MSGTPSGTLATVLQRSQDLGFLGPGPVADQVERSLHAMPVLRSLLSGAPLTGSSSTQGGVPGRDVVVMDLGSGGGIPGLPLCLACPDSWRWILLDGSVTRTKFLVEAVDELGVAGRVEVITARAEEAARRPELRSAVDLIVARSFGAPAVTAECAAGFLVPGGHLVVAEPPGGAPERWPEAGLSPLGLTAGPVHVGPTSFQVLTAVAPCPDRYPRRVGVPSKRPLF